MWWPGHGRIRSQLSPYLDGRLSEGQRRQLEAHLDSCQPCRQHLDELRLTVEALRGLPQEPAPRSFALRPEQLQRPRPSPLYGLYGALPLATRLAGVAAAFALAAVLVADFGDFGGGGPERVAAPAAEQEAQEEEAGAPLISPTPALGLPAYAVAEQDRTERSPAPSPAPGETGIAYAPAAPPRAENGGGIDGLRAAEIGLAAALGTLVVASGATVLLRRAR